MMGGGSRITRACSATSQRQPSRIFTIQLPIAELRRSEEHTSELQSHLNLVCRLLLEKKKKKLPIDRDSSRKTMCSRLGLLLRQVSGGGYISGIDSAKSCISRRWRTELGDATNHLDLP